MMSCPLEGTCAECGLPMRWAEVVAPDKFVPRWSVEYETGSIGILRGAARCVLRSFRPWRFWKSMKLSDPVRGKRLVVYVLLLVMLPAVLAWLEQGVAAVAVRYRMGTNPQVRAIAYSYTEAVFDAMLRPMQRTSTGIVFLWGGQSFAYPTVNGWSLQAGFPLAEWGAALGFAVVVALILPATFVLLPISRRRAKVRWPHVWRVAAYSLVIPSLAACLLVGVVPACIALRSQPGGLLMSAQLGLVVMPIPVLTVWWAMAIRRYLRLRHALLTAILLTVIAALVVPTATLLI